MASLKEQRLYKAFKEAAVGILNVSRIENSVGDGMSDLVVQNHYGVEIWIEAKALDCYPARPTTQYLRSEFRPGQLPFLRERISWGGHGFVLLKVGKECLILDPTNNPERVSGVNKECILFVGSLGSAVEYLEKIKYEDCPYAAPNHRPGTQRRKA